MATEYNESVPWGPDTTQRFLETSSKVDNIELEFSMHEVTLKRMDSRMLSMGGTIIIFLAGVIATLINIGAPAG